jgi:hypothetical protein
MRGREPTARGRKRPKHSASVDQGKAIEKHLSLKTPLQAIPIFMVTAKEAPQKDVLEKVTGKTQYAGDIRLPAMLYARILRPPAHEARLGNPKGIPNHGGAQRSPVFFPHTDISGIPEDVSKSIIFFNSPLVMLNPAFPAGAKPTLNRFVPFLS